MEIELTKLNAKRSLSKAERRLELAELGNCLLLRDAAHPQSPYYNRVKGFGPGDIPLLSRILDHYGESPPCFDLTPDHMTADVSQALLKQRYMPAEQLAFMAAKPMKQEISDLPELQIERVTGESAETFISWIARSNGETLYSRDIVDRVKGYFHASHFHNYMLTIDGQPAAMGSLFLHGNEGYLANDYTFEEFRGRGCQTALISRRLSIAAELGLEYVYTDVEFGSVSHANMKKAGFHTAFINTFWMHG
ncbi:GNAT family N-acetyltransferase [Paenibacillus sinensis]|nr:GNAT family N-acetyltransferase [Paenibacillus sinensis]